LGTRRSADRTEVTEFLNYGINGIGEGGRPEFSQRAIGRNLSLNGRESRINRKT
jgi:hypothetical protein